MRFLVLILKNLRRNPIRTFLTALAVVAFVVVFSLIVSVLLELEGYQSEKDRDIMVVISDRFRIMMPFDRSRVDPITTSGSLLNQQLSRIPGFRADRFTVWHFAQFSLDPAMKDPDQTFFLLATIPDMVPTMTDGLRPGEVDPRVIPLMRNPPRSHVPGAGVVMGAKRMRKLGLKVGDVLRARSVTHREGDAFRRPIELHIEIVAEIPITSRWNDVGFIDYDYFDRVLEDKNNEYAGRIHYAWLRVADKESAEQVCRLVEKYDREIRCETAATAYRRFLEPLRDLLWGVKYLLVPAIVVVMAVILANTFSITVRERTTEMAVLKVLGFSSRQILTLVLGEAALVGGLSGFTGSVVIYGTINWIVKGINLGDITGIALSAAVLWWGPVLGLITALAGSIVPAWAARNVRVSDVFASVA